MPPAPRRPGSAASWVTFMICVGYALYFSLRKRYGLTSPAMFGLETALLCLVAVAIVLAAALTLLAVDGFDPSRRPRPGQSSTRRGRAAPPEADRPGRADD